MRIIQADYRAAIEKAAGPFDLVFLDPPYRMTDVYAEAARRLHEAGRLADGALLVMEHDASSPVGGIEPPFAVEDERKYRDTALTLVRYRENQA